jgi:hypothetical protein
MYDNSQDRYPHFSELIKERFKTFNNDQLFTTDVENLFDTFINNLPQEARQHYTCNCCRHFVNRFGGLVSISEKGEISSVLWDEQNIPIFFRQSVKALKEIVLKSRVSGVFISSEKTLGQPHSNGWDHMAVTLPANKVFRITALKNADQEMASKKQDFGSLVNGLTSFTPDNVD